MRSILIQSVLVALIAIPILAAREKSAVRGFKKLILLYVSFGLFYTVLATSNHPRWARFTRYAVAGLVAIYITFESPLSGMSMNPARTFASAAVGEFWTALWIYFLAPPLGMVAAAAVYRFTGRRRHVFCAKLHHHNPERCIFRCNWSALNAE